jgi:uncharacterized membrane protein
MSRLRKLTTFYNIYLGLITTLAALPVLAPILLKLGLIFPAKIIYFVYSFFCHQFATRSIHIYDLQYAWCARDTGIWTAVALTAWALKMKIVRPIKWYWVIPFSIPIALDGGIQTIFTMLNLSYTGGLAGIPLYSSNNLVRFLTGAFFGIGLSLWISGTFIEHEFKDSIVENKKYKLRILNFFGNSQVRSVARLMMISFVLYAFSVSIWQLTSRKVLPTDSIDSAVKLQSKNFFERRTNGICPTKGAEDLINFECFFK